MAATAAASVAGAKASGEDVLPIIGVIEDASGVVLLPPPTPPDRDPGVVLDPE